MTFARAFGFLLVIALASLVSGRLIVAAFRLRRLLRCDPTSAAASTILGTVASVVAASRLSELGLPAPRIVVALLSLHGVLCLVAMRHGEGRAFRPIGPASGWAALIVVVLLTALTGLLPVLLTGGFGIGYDTFIYCSSAEWLQDHAFSEPAERSLMAPVAGVVRTWQVGGLNLGASHALAAVTAAGASAALVAYPVASTWALVLSALAVMVAGRWALRMPPAWATGASLAFALLPNPALWSHHNGFFAQTYGMPGLLLGLATMGRRPRGRDSTLAVLVGLTAAYTLLIYVPFLAFLGAAGVVWVVGLLRHRGGGTLRRAWPAIAALLVLLGAAGLDLRPLHRELPALVTAVVGGPITLSKADWLAFAMGTRALGVGPPFLEVSSALSLAAALGAAVLVLAGVAVAARRPSAHALLAAALVLAAFVVWYGGFAPDSRPGQTPNTWYVFKTVKWAYPLVLLLQMAAVFRLRCSRGRYVGAILCLLVLTLASAQVAWARGFGLTMRKAVATESPLQEAILITDRFRALPPDRVVLLGRPASLSNWLAMYTALFAYPRTIALDWEDSPPLGVETPCYRADLERLKEPGLVFLAAGLEGLSGARVEPLGGGYVRLLEPGRPQLAQVLTPYGVSRDRETGRPFFRLGPDRTKLVLVAAEPLAARLTLELLEPSPLPVRMGVQVVRDAVGGLAYRAAIREAPVRESTAAAGAPLEIDLSLGGGQTTIVLVLDTSSGTAGALRVGRVSVHPQVR